MNAVTKSECINLHKFIGDHIAIPRDCKTAMINPDDRAGGVDEPNHRNSWLWPKLARRATQSGNHKAHPNNHERPVGINEDGCAALLQALTKQLGPKSAQDLLPKGCKA